MQRRGRARSLSEARARELRPLLERFERQFDKAHRVGFDPVELPRRHADPEEQEVAGLFASALAYGRADVFKPRLERVLDEMRPSPARFCEAMARAPSRTAFAGFQYRFNQPPDIAALAAAAGHVRIVHGGLGLRLAVLLREEHRAAHDGATPSQALRRALARFAQELREAPPARALLRERGLRGLTHLLPDPGGPGACKRWNLYLRWMVRGPDAVDLGAWRGIPPSVLVVPLDTHVARIARYLGLTDRRDMTWRTAEEITESLRRIDPDDPVRFDFVLCHLGMSGACPVRRDPSCCAVCSLRGGCRAARSRSARAGTSSPAGARAAP